MSMTTQEDDLKMRQAADAALRAGNFQQAQDIIKSRGQAAPLRSSLAQWARLARRAHLWRLSLLWLHPVIRPIMEGIEKPPSEIEKCEYAIALQKAGALRESMKLALSIDPEIEPRAYMTQAYVHMSQWNYAEAKPLWRKFLDQPGLEEYERLIGEVNRVACLVANSPEASRNSVDALVDRLIETPHRLLAMNALELQAQSRLRTNDFDEAEKILSRAIEMIERENKVLDSLFVLKWRAVIEAFRKQATEPLEAFRASALELRHWETLRDLDFYRAILKPRSEWVTWVYYGSPFPAFRERLEKSLKATVQFPEQQILSRSPNPNQTIDVWFTEHQDGSLAHRAFAFLLRDFYRPSRVAEIFSALFPDEYYNPESAPARVHKVIERTRSWIEEQSLQCRIEQTEGEYALRFDDSVGFKIHKTMISFSASGFIFQRRQNQVPFEFDAADWAEASGVSRSTASKQLQTAVHDGVLTQTKEGRGALFRFISQA